MRRGVFASTGGAVYGDQREFPAPEDHPQYPISPYGVSKLAGERYLHFCQTQYGLSYAALCYANVYGPRQDPHGEAGVVAIFCGNLAAGRPSTINGTGEQTRDYVYVEDVARANVLALESDAPPERTTSGPGSRRASTSSTRSCAIPPEETCCPRTVVPNRANNCAAPWTRPPPLVPSAGAPRRTSPPASDAL